MFIDKYGDIEVVFDCVRNSRFEYIGECAGVAVQAITCYMYDLEDYTVKVGEKIKIRNLKFLETVDGFEIDKFITMDNQGVGFWCDLSEGDKIKYRITKVTYDDEDIFLKSEIVETDCPIDKDKWVQDCFDNLQDKLRIEIENGRGDKYKIASYKDKTEISNEALEMLVKQAGKYI